MLERDIAAGMRLKVAAGWNQTEDDWRLFLSLHPGGCYVACDGEDVAGTVTTLRYGDEAGWIAMLLVDPATRRQGIGTRLMRRAIEGLSGCATIGLDATPEREPRFNVAPGQDVATVAADREGHRVLALRRWGLLPYWAKDPKLFTFKDSE